MNAIARNMTDPVQVARLERAILITAELMVDRPEVMPIFARLESELAGERAKSDPVARARKMMADEAKWRGE